MIKRFLVFTIIVLSVLCIAARSDFDDIVCNDLSVTGTLSLSTYLSSYTAPGDTGTHDGADNAAVLTDSGETFSPGEYVGDTLYNTTDGSSCTVTANTRTTITCTLSGGTDHDWDIGDTWTINGYGRLKGAVDAIGTTAQELVIDVDDTVAEDTAVPDTISLSFARRSVLSVSSGKTLSLPSTFDCMPEYFGAVADNSTSDVDAINLCVQSGSRLVLSANTGYAIDDQIIMDNAGQEVNFRNGAFIRQTDWGSAHFIVAAANVTFTGLAKLTYTGDRTDLDNLSGDTYCCDTCEKEKAGGIVLTGDADGCRIDDLYVDGQVSGISTCDTDSQIENVHVGHLRVDSVDMGIIGKWFKALTVGSITATDINKTQGVDEHVIYLTASLTGTTDDCWFGAITVDNTDGEQSGATVSIKSTRNAHFDSIIVSNHEGQIFVSNTGSTASDSLGNYPSTATVNSIIALDGITLDSDFLVSVAWDSEIVVNNINAEADISGSTGGFFGVSNGGILYVNNSRLVNTTTSDPPRPFFYCDATMTLKNPVMILKNDDYDSDVTECAILAQDDCSYQIFNPRFVSDRSNTAEFFYEYDGASGKLQYDPNMIQASFGTEVIRDESNNSENHWYATAALITPLTIGVDVAAPMLRAANVLKMTDDGDVQQVTAFRFFGDNQRFTVINSDSQYITLMHNTSLLVTPTGANIAYNNWRIAEFIQIGGVSYITSLIDY